MLTLLFLTSLCGSKWLPMLSGCSGAASRVRTHAANYWVRLAELIESFCPPPVSLPEVKKAMTKRFKFDCEHLRKTRSDIFLKKEED